MRQKIYTIRKIQSIYPDYPTNAIVSAMSNSIFWIPGSNGRFQVRQFYAFDNKVLKYLYMQICDLNGIYSIRK